MYRNNLKLIISHFLRNGLSSAVSVIGLGIGLALSLVLFIYVQHEVSYDKQLKDVNKMYRVYLNSSAMQLARSLLVIGDELVERSPYVDASTSFLYSAKGVLKNEKDGVMVSENDIMAVDSNFMEFFGVELVNGNPGAMNEPNTAFITEDIAAKYFGKQNPIGKALDMESIQYNENMGVYTIAGVVKNPPSNIHFKYAILLSQEGDLKARIDRLKVSKLFGSYTYIKVNSPNKLSTIKGDMQAIISEKLANTRGPSASGLPHDLQPVTDIHLKSSLAHELKPVSSPSHLLLIFSVGIIILFVSLLNFIILHSSKMLKRGKEIAIKRLCGANSISLLKYFVVESIFYSLLSLIISVLILELSRPYLNRFIQVDIPLHFSSSFSIITIALILLLSVFMYNVFAILLIRKLNFLDTLKLGVGGKSKGNRVRRILTVVQFSWAIGLLVFSYSVYQQLSYIQSKDLGFKSSSMLILKNPDRRKSQISLKNELLTVAGVKGVCRCNQYPSYPMNGTTIPLPGEAEVSAKLTICDEDFVKTMGVEVIEILNDTSRNCILVNQRLAKIMKEAYNNDWDRVLAPFVPAGIIKDFHITSLRSGMEPFFLNVIATPDRPFSYMLISYDKVNMSQTIDNVRQIWTKFYQSKPFDYIFIEDALSQQYKAEKQALNVIIIILMVIFVIIGMGLLGTVSIMLKNRKKEIGIRKLMGASDLSLLTSEIKRISMIIVLALLIATPLTYLLVEKWLMNFHYNTGVNPWIFLASGAAALLFSWIIIIWMVLRAVRVNTVECLRYE